MDTVLTRDKKKQQKKTDVIEKHVDPLTPSCWVVIYAAGRGGRETCTPPDGDSSPPPLEPSLQLLPSESQHTGDVCLCVCACV